MTTTTATGATAGQAPATSTRTVYDVTDCPYELLAVFADHTVGDPYFERYANRTLLVVE